MTEPDVPGGVPEATAAARHGEPGAAGSRLAVAGEPRRVPVVRIRLLGRFSVRSGSREIPAREFGGRRAGQLLRLLALRRDTLVSKDVIIEALWPARAPADAPGSVEVLVSRIRRAMGDRALIRTGPGGYALAGGDRCWVDAEAFLAAVAEGRTRLAGRHPRAALAWFGSALEIWRGEPLAEDAYAQWAQQDRSVLLSALFDALEGAAAAALRAGDPAEAATRAGQALAADPVRESAMMLLAEARAAGGDRAGALAAFDAFGRRLARDTGLDPSPAAREIRQRILLSEPPPSGDAHVPASTRSGPILDCPTVPGPFTGRAGECAAILAAARGQGPQVIVITGRAGVGKSRLLAEAARMAPGPVLAVPARAPDRDQAGSLARRLLALASELAGAETESSSPDAPACDPPAAAPPTLAAVLDALVAALAALTPPRPVTSQVRCRSGSSRLDGEAARSAPGAVPLTCLLVVDDLHWADEASLGLIGLLLRRHRGVGLAAARRPGGQPDGFSAAEAFGLPDGHAGQITLGPPADGAIQDLLDGPGLARAVLEQARAGPLAATEIIAALAGRGEIHRDDCGRWRPCGPAGNHSSGAVAAAVHDGAVARLARLTAGQRELLLLLAVVGRPASATLLAEAAGQDPCEVVDGLAELAGAGMTSAGPEGWGVAHEVFSRAIEDIAGSAGMLRSHTLLGHALHAGEADPGEVAAHLLAGGDRLAAANTCATAAARLLEQARDDEAVRLAETGLSLVRGGRTRGLLLAVRGEVCHRRGRLAEARADLNAALRILDDAGDRSRLLAQLALLEARAAGVTQGDELAGLAITEAGQRASVLGQALAAGAIIDLAAGNLGRAAGRAGRAARLLDREGDLPGAAWLLYQRAMASFFGGRLAEAAGQLGRLAELPVISGETHRLWSPRATRGHALALLGQGEAGLAEIDEELARARAAGHLTIEAECLWHRGEALAFLGRADEATATARQALAIAVRIGHAEWTAASLRGLGVAWEAAGRLDRAASALRRSLRAAAGEPVFAAWAQGRLGACLARQGRPQDAVVHVYAAMRRGTPLTRHEARWASAEWLAARGENAACHAAAASALKSARDGGYLVLVPRLAELAGALPPPVHKYRLMVRPDRPGAGTDLGQLAAAPLIREPFQIHEMAVYFTDRGIEELGERRGEDEVTFAWLAARLQEFAGLHPEFGVPVNRLATWLARADDEGGLP